MAYSSRLRATQAIKIYDILFATLLACLLTPLTTASDATSSASTLSTPFTDQLTGLTMERFFGARTSFGFALATSSSPNTTSTSTASSFIGKLDFPLQNGQGWGAMGLIGDMDGNFILAAWPDGKGGVMASFRQATNEDNPPEVTGKFAVRPLPDGINVNDTFLSYTFLCEHCLDATLGLKLDTAGNAVMGWALSAKPPKGDPSDPGAQLGFHEQGFGPFTARLGSAGSAQFEAVAGTALAPVTASRKAVAAVAGAAGGGSGDEGGDDSEKDGGEDSDDEDD